MRCSRAAAQVLEAALAVQAHVLAGRDALDDLGLVVLAESLEVGHGLVARQHPTDDRLVLRRQLGHALLDRRQVLGRERALVGEVVIEAVVDHRADRHLGLGEQLLDGIGQQVRRAVADDLEAVGILVGDDRERRIGLDAVARVDEPAVDLAGQRGLRQARADRGGHLGHRRGMDKLAPGAVRQRDPNHLGNLQKRRSAGVTALRGVERGRARATDQLSAKSRRVVRGVITRRAFPVLVFGGRCRDSSEA